jgi:hypothetical protein
MVTIKSFEPHRVELSNGVVITNEENEYDYDIIKAILEACDDDENNN